MRAICNPDVVKIGIQRAVREIHMLILFLRTMRLSYIIAHGLGLLCHDVKSEPLPMQIVSYIIRISQRSIDRIDIPIDDVRQHRPCIVRPYADTRLVLIA